MEFKVLDRERVRHIRSKVPFVIISISDDTPGLPSLHDDSNLVDVLELAFHDIQLPKPGFVAFDKSHADKILQFYLRYRNEVGMIVAHCNAGMCRSPATIAALQRIHGESDADWFKTKTPNSRVYSMLLDVAVQDGIYDPWKENV